MKRSSIVLFIFLISYPIFVRSQEYKYELGIISGATGYLGDANRTIPFASPGLATAVQGRYNINFRFVGFLSLGYYLFRGNNFQGKNRFPHNAQAKFATSTILVNPAMEYNFYPYSDKYPFLQTKRLSPYLSLGIVLGTGFKDGGGLFFFPGFSGFLGLKYKVANQWNLQCQLGGMYLFTDGLEKGTKEASFFENPYNIAKAPWKGTDGGVFFLFGVTYEFGSTKASCSLL